MAAHDQTLHELKSEIQEQVDEIQRNIDSHYENNVDRIIKLTNELTPDVKEVGIVSLIIKNILGIEMEDLKNDLLAHKEQLDEVEKLIVENITITRNYPFFNTQWQPIHTVTVRNPNYRYGGTINLNNSNVGNRTTAFPYVRTNPYVSTNNNNNNNNNNYYAGNVNGYSTYIARNN